MLRAIYLFVIVLTLLWARWSLVQKTGSPLIISLLYMSEHWQLYKDNLGANITCNILYVHTLSCNIPYHPQTYHPWPEQKLVGRHSLNISLKAKLIIFEMAYFINSVVLAWKRSVAADLMVADYVISHEFFGKVFLHFCQLWVWKLGLDTCFYS